VGRIFEAYRDYNGASHLGHHHGCFGPRMACSIAETHGIDQGVNLHSPPHGQQRPVSLRMVYQSVYAKECWRFRINKRSSIEADSDGERCRSTCPLSLESRHLDAFRLRRTGCPYHRSAAGLLISATLSYSNMRNQASRQPPAPPRCECAFIFMIQGFADQQYALGLCVKHR